MKTPSIRISNDGDITLVVRIDHECCVGITIIENMVMNYVWTLKELKELYPGSVEYEKPEHERYAVLCVAANLLLAMSKIGGSEPALNYLSSITQPNAFLRAEIMRAIKLHQGGQ